jgi:hypothetical protein
MEAVAAWDRMVRYAVVRRWIADYIEAWKSLVRDACDHMSSIETDVQRVFIRLL